MKLNIFEGARRITKLIAVIWIMGWGYYLITYTAPNTLQRLDSVTSKIKSPAREATQAELQKIWDEATPFVYQPCDKSGQPLQVPQNQPEQSQLDDERIDGEKWPARWKEIKESSSLIIGGVVSLFIFSWCVGWIVRGFAGIPLGQDRKPDDI